MKLEEISSKRSHSKNLRECDNPIYQTPPKGLWEIVDKIRKSDWNGIKVTSTSVSALKSFQKNLWIPNLEQMRNCTITKPIHLVKYNSVLWIVDGNHRTVTAMIKGVSETLAKILEIS